MINLTTICDSIFSVGFKDQIQKFEILCESKLHIQGPPWHNVKLRSPFTKSEIEMHHKLLHINSSTPQTICFIKQNHKLFH